MAHRRCNVDPDPDADLHGAFRCAQLDPAGLRHDLWRGDSFPLWFALIALLAAPSGPVNGVLVMRLGMRPMIRGALWLTAAGGARTGAVLSSCRARRGLRGLFLWTVTVFATAAFTIGNLNALALEPMGHIAGTASSLMGALATVGGAVGRCADRAALQRHGGAGGVLRGLALGLAGRLSCAACRARRWTADSIPSSWPPGGARSAGGRAPYSAGVAASACTGPSARNVRCHHHATTRTFGTQQVQPR
jgi:hypothetical protein